MTTLPNSFDIPGWPLVSGASAPADTLPLTEERVREIVREELRAFDARCTANAVLWPSGTSLGSPRQGAVE